MRIRDLTFSFIIISRIQRIRCTGKEGRDSGSPAGFPRLFFLESDLLRLWKTDDISKLSYTNIAVLGHGTSTFFTKIVSQLCDLVRGAMFYKSVDPRCVNSKQS